LQAIPALIGRLGDDFAGEAAADALVRIGAPSVPALCRLLTADEEGNGRPQAFAVEVLGRIGGPAVHVALRSVLEDSDPAVRLGAALGLSRLQPGSARNVLGILLESLPDAGPATREEILHAISRLGSEAEGLLLEVLREAGSPVLPRVRGAVEAVGHLRTRHAVADLTRLAEEPDSRLRLAAVSSLGAIPGPAPVWGLSRFLRDSDACVRIAAARGLGIRGSPGGRALAGALGDPEPAVRRVAEREILALGRAALPGLRSAMVASRRESWLSLGRWRHLKSARRLLRLIERLHLEAAPHADRPGETRRGDATSAIRPKVP
jgi:HEAT repeat protein